MKHKMKYLHTVHNKYNPDVIIFECENCDERMVVEQRFWQEATIGGPGYHRKYSISPCKQNKDKLCNHCGKVIRFNIEDRFWYHPLQGIWLDPIWKINCHLLARPL